MKRPKYISAISALTIATVMSLTLTETASAQGDPGQYQKEAIAAMKKGDWANAVVPLDKCIEAYGTRAKNLGLGDKFGWFYYQRGLCQMQLGEYQKAIESFDKCYTAFPSPENEFLHVALYRKGEAQFLAEDHAGAIKSIEKFMKERSNKGQDAKVNTGQLYCILAQCYLSDKSSFNKGLDALAKCVANRNKGAGVSDKYLVQAFTTLVESAMEQGRPQDALNFLRGCPGILNIGPVRIASYGPSIFKLSNKVSMKAADEQKAGNADASLTYLQLATIISGYVPNTDEVTHSIEDLEKKMGDKLPAVMDGSISYNKKALDASLKLYKKLADENTPLDGYALTGMARQLQQFGSLRGAEAVYRILEERFPDMKEREDNQYQRAMIVWSLGDINKAQDLINTHLKDFPNSKYASVLNTLSLEKLLKEQKYDLCIEQARKVKELNAADPNNKFYILACYCEPIALVSTKQFKEAIPLMQDFLKAYPDSNFTQQIAYFLGSSFTSLGQWQNAADAYTAYIKKYPSFDNNPYMPNALAERALCYLQMNTPETDKKAWADCETIVEKLADSKVYPNALLMMGNMESQDPDKLDSANETYIKAVEAARKCEDKRTLSEAVYNLVANYVSTGKAEDKAKAQEYYDLFWKECDSEKNPFAIQTAVSGMTLHKDGGDGYEPARQKLAEIIVRESKANANSSKVEQAVGSYTKMYIDAAKNQGKELSLDEIKAHFYNFPGVSADDVSCRTMLRTAVIGVYQDKLRELKPEQAEEKAVLEGTINVFFKELMKDFKPEDLTTYTLNKLGSHIAETDQPLNALPYFDEILKRNNGYKKEATFGRAIALGRSKDNAKIEEAVKIMSAALAEERGQQNPDRKSMEEAQAYLVRFEMDKQDYAQVEAQAKTYLEDKSYKKFQPEMMFDLGVALDKQNKLDEALGAYMNLVNTYKGLINWSAPGVLGVMDVMWRRNKPKPDVDKPSDRYNAWTYANNYLKLTEPNLQRMTVPERNKWRQVQELAKKYGADPAVAEEQRNTAERQRLIRESQGKK